MWPFGLLQGAHGDGHAAAVAHPPRRGPATRAGRVYGRGTYTRGQTQVHLSRALRPGKYRLTLRESSKRDGAARHTIKTILRIRVPGRAGT